MIPLKKLFLAVILSFGVCLAANAQYYVSETDPANFRWKQIERDSLGKVIYPDFIEDKAFIVAEITDSVRPYIHHGLNDLVGKFPITLHPANILSNGMVTWTPKRMELLTVPQNGSFAVPWLKQLAVHEFRHVVQLSNLNQGFTKGGFYVLGEQAPGLVSAILPKYFYEGDAVAAETEMTMYGRALQPEFTVGYRAMLNEDTGKLNVGKLILGSYKDYVPDAYELGYQVTQFAREYYGDDYWARMLNFVGRRSYTIFAFYFGSRKLSGEGSHATVRRAMHDLREFWKPVSAVDNNFLLLPASAKGYATYSHPQPLGATHAVSLVESRQAPCHFVLTDLRGGKERNLGYTGYPTSRPVLHDSTLYWTEYRPSVSWGNKNRSIVLRMELRQKDGRWKSTRSRTAGKPEGDLFYVTPTDDGFALVAYDERNRPSLVLCGPDFREQRRFALPGAYTSLNGLAWDGKTGTLAGILLDEEGMYLCAFSRTDGAIRRLTEPSYITLNNLSAGNGKLYFNSIQSGKDEIHTFDLQTGREERQTVSKYGSVAPQEAGDGVLLFTAYTRQGYRPALLPADSALHRPVEPAKMPLNLVNYPFKSWGLPKVDTMTFRTDGTGQPAPKRYRKGAHLFKVHSWMPFYFNVNRFMEEQTISLAAGAYVLSQNTLNTMVAGAGYGYTGSSHLGTVDLAYTGLPVHFSFSARYGGGDQLVYNNVDRIIDLKRKPYFSTGLTAALPLNFSSGSRLRSLQFSLGYNYNNGIHDRRLHGNTVSTYETGIHKMASAVSFSNTGRRAVCDLSPRLGYYLRATAVYNPFSTLFGEIYSALGIAYLPGFLPNHSTTVRLGLQRQVAGEQNYIEKILFPTGVRSYFAAGDLFGATIDYKAPLAYPDWGIFAYNFYLKRIWIDVFGEYARYSLLSRGKPEAYYNAYTYGGTLWFDANYLNFSGDISVGFSLYKPSDSKRPHFGVKFGMNF